QRPDHADGDLAAVGYQDSRKHGPQSRLAALEPGRFGAGAGLRPAEGTQRRGKIGISSTTAGSAAEGTAAAARKEGVRGGTRGSPTSKADWPTVDGLELEQQLAVLDRLAVLGVDPRDEALLLGLDLVHQLHRLEDAEGLAGADGVALLDERRRARRRGAVKGADHRRLDPDHAGIERRRGRRGGSRLLLRGRRRRRGCGDRVLPCLGRPADRDAETGVLDRHLADARVLDDADDLADALGAARVDPDPFERLL